MLTVVDFNWRMRKLVITNREVSPENPDGGFLWEAHGHLFDNRYVLAYYTARDELTRSKGTLYLVLHQSGRHMTGNWVGCNYDFEWAHGLVALSREKEAPRTLLQNHRDVLQQMPYNSLMEG